MVVLLDDAVIASMETSNHQAPESAQPQRVGSAYVPLDLNLHIVWSTSASSFGLVPRRCPPAVWNGSSIIIFVRKSIFTRTTSRLQTRPEGAYATSVGLKGYNICVQPYNLSDVLASEPAAPLLKRLGGWQQRLYVYSHVTDSLR